MLRPVRVAVVMLVAGWTLARLPASPRRSPENDNPGDGDGSSDDQAVAGRSPGRLDVLNALSAIVAVIGAVTAIASAIIAADQQELAKSSADQQSNLDDLQFVGRIAISLDPDDKTITLSNYSNLPLSEAALWTLGLSDGTNGTRLDTVRAALTGLGACRTMKVPLTTVVRAVARQGSQAPAVTEPYLTFKAPSQKWYTISEATVLELVVGAPRNAIEASELTYSDYILADTTAEGVDSEDTLIAEQPIGPAGLTTQRATGDVQMLANGCEGPGPK